MTIAALTQRMPARMRAWPAESLLHGRITGSRCVCGWAQIPPVVLVSNPSSRDRLRRSLDRTGNQLDLVRPDEAWRQPVFLGSQNQQRDVLAMPIPRMEESEANHLIV